MKPRPIPERLVEKFDALGGHRRRAAAVATLLELCDVDGLHEEVLAEAARFICAELDAVGECAERILEQLRR